jgi:3-dehydroquinate synthase
MVDSSVGGKTAINAAAGKNLVGAFHQPAAVWADTDLLATLPAREMRAGYAEILKYGLLGDAGFFAWLEREGAAVLAGDGAALGHAVATSVRAKAAIVAADEEERLDIRALLNLGHTFGHALEAETGFSDALLHGEAVAIGMAQAFRFSVREGLCPPADAARVDAHLSAMGLAARLPLPADRLVAHMLHDKKRTEAGLPFILVRGIGAAFVAHGVPIERVRAFLEEEASAQPEVPA